MSTVAWDGQRLAADTRCTSSGLPSRVKKCCRLRDGTLFAGTGVMSGYEAVRAWLDQECDRPAAGALKEFNGMIIDHESRIWLMDETTYRYQIFQPFHAIGSGRDFAIAAMALGKTSLEAVELASRFDIWTAGPITQLTLTQAE